jgi:hypothetical protein
MLPPIQLVYRSLMKFRNTAGENPCDDAGQFAKLGYVNRRAGCSAELTPDVHLL